MWGGTVERVVRRRASLPGVGTVQELECAAVELLAENNLFSFFYDRVQEARRVQSVEVEEDTEFYLVNMLVDFLRTRRLIEVGGERVQPFRR